MRQVDFGYVTFDGFTIYSNCFQKYLKRFMLEISESDWAQLVTETEAVFEFLVEQGIDYGYDIDSILEIPNSTGETCFSIASNCSEKISNFIIGRGIKVNSIKSNMMVPAFKYPKLTIQMMEKGINPHVIDYSGGSEVDFYQSSFESEEAKRLLVTFPRSVHYSIEDIE